MSNKVQGRTIAVVGSMNMDLAVNTEELPKAGETIVGSSIQQSPGGKGANQAVSAALVGGRVSLIAMRGEDAFGKNLVDSARDSGVDISLIQISEKEKTGTAVIIVDSHAENVIVISPGANSQLNPEVVKSSLLKIPEAAVVSVCMEVPIESVRQALVTGNEIGAVTVLNLSPFTNKALDLLPLAEILVVNQHEVSSITGISDPESWQATTASLKELGSRKVVVTLGSSGAVVLDCGQEAGSPITVEAVKVVAVDTTGCGDAFAGALCVELAAGGEIIEAVEFAVKVAGHAAKSPGAQTSYGTREQVLAG
jgi:ribokinase